MKLPFKLAPFQSFILNTYLIPLNPGTPIDVLLLTLNMEISKLLSFKRVKIKGVNTDVFPNLYGLVFMGSGRGKDRSINTMKAACTKTTEIMEMELAQYKKIGLNKAIEDLNIEKMQRTDLNKMTKNEERAFLKERTPRQIALEVGSATVEGLHAQRFQLQAMGYGICHYVNTEFIDAIKDTRGPLFAVLSYLKDAYETGSSTAKAIKGENTSNVVKNVPQTFMAHSSVAPLVDDESATVMLRNFFATGYARRALICYSVVRDKPVYETLEEQMKRIDGANSMVSEIESRFEEVYNCFTVGQSFPMTEECDRMHNEYEKLLEVEVYEMEKRGVIDESLTGERSSRHRKTIRLAGVIAAFSHPKNREVTVEDYEIARSQVEHYGRQFISFYERKPLLPEEMLLKEFRKNGSLSLADLKKMPMFKIRATERTALMKEMLFAVDELLAETGEFLSKETVNKVVTYSIASKHVEAEAGVSLLAKFSYSQDFSLDHPVNGYQYMEAGFSMLHTFVANPDKYSAYACHGFAKGYRNKENVRHTGNLLMIDIDNDDPNDMLSIGEATRMVSKFVALVVPTINHRKAKGTHGVADRFRIIILCDDVIKPTVASYKDLGKNMLEELGLLKYADESVSADEARYLRPSPADASYVYTIGTKLFSWKQFDVVRKPDAMKTEPVAVRKDVNYDNTDFETRKTTMDYSTVAAKIGVVLKPSKRSNGNQHYWCPFHNSSGGTSFWVTEENNLWVCAGPCNEGGDIVAFVMKALDCTFLEAKKVIMEI